MSFFNKVSGLGAPQTAGVAKDTLKASMVLSQQVKALLAEGIIADSLSQPASNISRDAVRSVLADVAGGQIQGSLMHPDLLRLAGEFVN